MGNSEKSEAVIFTTPLYNTGHGDRNNPTSIDLPNVRVESAGGTIQPLNSTVNTHIPTSVPLRFSIFNLDFAFLSAFILASLSQVRSLIDRIFHRDNIQPQKDEGKLIVKDSRSGKSYDVPIRRGSVDAMQFRQMITTSSFSALLGRPLKGSLKVLDVGYQNTACAESSITYVYAPFLYSRTS
jgi:hypothetical protein